MGMSGNSKIQESTRKRLPPNAGKGRKKGVPNKITKTLKEAILETLNDLGGKTWLRYLAETDPRAFASLLARLIPTETRMQAEVTGENGEPIQTGVIMIPSRFSTYEEWKASLEAGEGGNDEKDHG